MWSAWGKFIPGKVERGGADNSIGAHVFIPNFKLDGGLTMSLSSHAEGREPVVSTRESGDIGAKVSVKKEKSCDWM